MKTKRIVLAAAMATSVALLAAGCSSGGSDSGDSGEEVDFTADFAGTTMNASGFTLGDEVATSRADYAEAQLKKKDAKVKLNQSNFDPQKFTTRAASGQLPDLVAMDRQYVATYASKGLIVPVEKCFDAQDVNAQEHWYSSVLTDVKYDGKVYGIPQFWQPWAVILNTRVMEATGVTKADLDTSNPEKVLAATKKMYEESGGKPTRLGFDPQLPAQASIWMIAFGGKIMDENGKPTLTDPKNVEAMSWLKKIYDAQGGYKKAYSFGQTWDFFGAENQYVKDQVGAGLYAQWYVNVLADFLDDITISAVPLRGPDGKAIAAASGQAYVIPAAAKNPAAACAWAVADTSDEAWMKAAEARMKTVKETPGKVFTGLFTASKTADQKIHDKYVKPTGNAGLDEAINAYYEELDNPRPLGSSPAGLEISRELQNAVVPIMTGDETPEEGLKQAQKKAMAVYKDATED